MVDDWGKGQRWCGGELRDVDAWTGEEMARFTLQLIHLPISYQDCQCHIMVFSRSVMLQFLTSVTFSFGSHNSSVTCISSDSSASSASSISHAGGRKGDVA